MNQFCDDILFFEVDVNKIADHQKHRPSENYVILSLLDKNFYKAVSQIFTYYIH